MQSTRRIFLGGTTGQNQWRKELIERFTARGISPDALIDPVVEHWTKEVQAQEDAFKADPNVIKVYYLGDTGTANGIFLSFYSLQEGIMGLYDAPAETALLFDPEGLVPRAAKRLLKACADLQKRFPAAPIFTSFDEFEQWAYTTLTSTTA